MQKAFATTTLAFIILLAAGCTTEPAQNAPDENTLLPKKELAFDERIENALNQSLSGGWRVESVELTGEMKTWEARRAMGARLTLKAPKNYDGDEFYTFWVFGPDFNGMTEGSEVFYYNRNAEYLLFGAEDSNRDIPLLPLNLVAMALGINDPRGEVGLVTAEEIAQIRKDIAAQNRAEANAMNKTITEIYPTLYSTIIRLNSRDDRITSAVIKAVTTLYPHKTCMIVRIDGQKQDWMITNSR